MIDILATHAKAVIALRDLSVDAWGGSKAYELTVTT